MAEPAPDPRPGARAAKALRIRYAVLGVVLAALWVGHAGEPAWEHALRTVLVLLTIRPLLRMTVKSRLRRARSQASTSRYVAWLIAFRLAVVGAALGASWLIGDLLDPAHRHGGVHALVVRLLVLALTIPLQLRFERRYRGRGLGGEAEFSLSWGRFVSAKVALVLVALGVEVLLQRWLGAGADPVVAAGLLVAVAGIGPWAHRRYLVRASPRDQGARSPGPRAGAASPDAEEGTAPRDPREETAWRGPPVETAPRDPREETASHDAREETASAPT
jgi:hypothetical protein